MMRVQICLYCVFDNAPFELNIICNCVNLVNITNELTYLLVHVVKVILRNIVKLDNLFVCKFH